MKPWLKTLLCITLSFMALFACVGYAAISSSIVVNGKVEAAMPEGIFITSITDYEVTNIDKQQSAPLAFSTSMETTLSRGTAAASGIVKYDVTVFNNTDVWEL